MGQSDTAFGETWFDENGKRVANVAIDYRRTVVVTLRGGERFEFCGVDGEDPLELAAELVNERYPRAISPRRL